MPDDHYDSDTDIIRAAYAEKVREAFKVFAENLGMGQNHASSTERFLRSLELVRKARDLALEVASGVSLVEPTVEKPATPDDGRPQVNLDLSSEDRKMIEQALSGTTGQRAVPHR